MFHTNAMKLGIPTLGSDASESGVSTKPAISIPRYVLTLQLEMFFDLFGGEFR